MDIYKAKEKYGGRKLLKEYKLEDLSFEVYELKYGYSYIVAYSTRYRYRLMKVEFKMNKKGESYIVSYIVGPRDTFLPPEGKKNYEFRSLPLVEYKLTLNIKEKPIPEEYVEDIRKAYEIVLKRGLSKKAKLEFEKRERKSGKRMG